MQADAVSDASAASALFEARCKVRFLELMPR
jgi:hypothetical protein